MEPPTDKIKVFPSLRPEVKAILQNIERVIKGKQNIANMALAAVFANGHVLFEDVPGTGKTTLANLIANSLGLSFAHVQMTSDMLPSDILGAMIYRPNDQTFEFHPGPIFANVIMADELNRTSPRTQSALLEAMSAAKVTVNRETHILPKPFIVLATQNPLEIHGTYPLPTSQLDRFLIRLHMGYPDPEAEARVLFEQKESYAEQNVMELVKPVMTAQQLLDIQQTVTEITVEQSLINAIVRFANITRESPRLEIGLSTRAAIGLRRIAQAWAWMQGRDYVVPDDIKQLILPVCAHRVVAYHNFETMNERSETESADTSKFRTIEETILKKIIDEFSWEW